jgi:hypothetical protein
MKKYPRIYWQDCGPTTGKAQMTSRCSLSNLSLAAPKWGEKRHAIFGKWSSKQKFSVSEGLIRAKQGEPVPDLLFMFGVTS